MAKAYVIFDIQGVDLVKTLRLQADCIETPDLLVSTAKEAVHAWAERCVKLGLIHHLHEEYNLIEVLEEAGFNVETTMSFAAVDVELYTKVESAIR
jgi:hypothetical protein